MNKTYIYAAIALAVGAAGGAATGIYISKKRYEARLAEEVESVKASYTRYIRECREKSSENTSAHEDVENDDDLQEYTTYTAIAGNYALSLEKGAAEQTVDYTSYTDESESSRNPDIPPSPTPVVVSEDYYYENEDDYTKIEIYLFDDGFMSDEDYEPIEDPNKIVQKADISKFLADDENDELFTKVDAKKCLYCISKQGETWDEVLRRHPFILETNY